MLGPVTDTTGANAWPSAGGWRAGWGCPLLLAAAAGTALAFMPLVLGDYPLFILCHMLVWSIACLGLNLLYGTAGSLSLGHATYFGAAAYAGAFLYRFFFVDSLEVYLLTGIVVAAVLASLIGLFCVRTTKIFFAILTLASSMVVYSLVIDGAIFRLFGGVGWGLYLLGGGSMYLPRFTILGANVAAAEFIAAFYNVVVAAFLACALALWRIDRSPFGQALRAIRDNETRAAFIGIAVRQYRWLAFVISGQSHRVGRWPVWAACPPDNPRPASLAVFGATCARDRVGRHAAFHRTCLGGGCVCGHR